VFLHEGASPSFVFTSNSWPLDPEIIHHFLGGAVSFCFFTGRFPQFEEHIFQMGWFNHPTTH